MKMFLEDDTDVYIHKGASLELTDNKAIRFQVYLKLNL